MKGFFFQNIFVSVSLITVAVISFATKAMLLQASPGGRTVQEIANNEVYSGLIGLICVDAFLVLFTFVTMITLCKITGSCLKILEILIVLIIMGRFILGVVFLAGNEDVLRNAVNDYNDMTDAQINALSNEQRNFYEWIKAAWIYEIIAITLTDILGTWLYILIGDRRKVEGEVKT